MSNTRELKTLECWLLGGRSLKRAFPQKAKFTAPHAIDGFVVGQRIEQVPQEANRRACTSAAMIGLAISMGASSLLVPQSGSSAVASEPRTAEPAATGLSVKPDSLTVVPSEEGIVQSEVNQSPEVNGLKHQVQSGQTLWDLARIYQVAPEQIASMNGFSVDVVLQVGQVLSIPAANQFVHPSTEVSQAIPSGHKDLGQSKKTAETESASEVKRLLEPEVLGQQQVGLLPLQGDASSKVALPADSQVAAPQALPNANGVRALPQLAVLPQTQRAALTLPNPLVESETLSAPSGSAPALNLVHRVKPGETLYSLARRYDVPYRELAKANQLRNPNLIRVGQVLQVPGRSSSVSVAAVSEAVDSSQRAVAVADQRLVGLSSASLTSQDFPVPSGVETTVVTRPAVAGDQLPSAVSQPRLQGERLEDQAQLGDAFRQGRRRGQPDADRSVDTLNQASVETLRAEIARMRDQFDSDLDVKSPVEVDVVETDRALLAGLAATVPQLPASAMQGVSRVEAVNPEFGAKPRAINDRASQVGNRTVVAVAPVGSENYAPIVKPLVGQAVSPDLPPLGSADQYLPGATQFNGYIWPTRGVLTSGYGWRWGRMHRGIDIAGPIGTPVVAAAPGVVVTAGWNSGGYGNLVEIKHEDGSLTLYAHNHRILVRKGQQVDQGDQIAEMGSTGYSTGPHLHFEVHLPGQGATNPISMLPRR